MFDNYLKNGIIMTNVIFLKSKGQKKLWNEKEQLIFIESKLVTSKGSNLWKQQSRDMNTGIVM